jgi:hypothetical protein
MSRRSLLTALALTRMLRRPSRDRHKCRRARRLPLAVAGVALERSGTPLSRVGSAAERLSMTARELPLPCGNQTSP